jgi:spore maturation protein CgeB
MRILYIGPDSGTCRHRRFALERLGHQVSLIDPFAAYPFPKLSRAWSFKTGALGLAGLVERYVLSLVGDRQFDLALVDGGEQISPRLIGALRKHAPILVNLNNDHPYAPRDGRRWRLVLQTLPLVDLYVAPRLSTAEAARRAGVRNVMQMNFAADEIAHRPITLSREDHARFDADVVFVGAWMPERGPFLARLVERGVPLRVYGPRWKKAPEYSILQPYVAGGAMEGDDYAKALQGAKIAIGLLSKGNEDLHTTRSLEVPAMGVLLCAERTSDHMAMYEDGVEAVFWDDADECADLCLELLADPACIRSIAEAGRLRLAKNGDYNEQLMAKVLATAIAVTAKA